MPSRRRSQSGFGELIIRLVGIGFMMLIMLCFLPGGGGAKAVAALEHFFFQLIVGICVTGLITLCVFVWISKSRRSNSGESIYNYSVKTDCSPAAAMQNRVPSKAEPAPLKQIDVVEQIRKIDWYQFEKLVALTYRKLGYTVDSRGGANPDGGIDLIIQKGGEPIAVQCKHWQHRDVPVATIREFVGALTDAKIKTGIFITLNGYTGDAKQLAERCNIAILNQTRLVEMLERADVRFDPEFRALLTDTRKVCPKCENTLVVRTTKRGVNAGREFWGCSSFPDCRFQMPTKA